MGVIERKEREKEQRKLDILNAAEYVFIEMGINGTTMELIAQKCEISRGTLYLYFKSKEEVFLSILMNGLDVFINMLESEIFKNTTGEQRLNAIGKAYLDFYKGYRNLFMIMNTVPVNDVSIKQIEDKMNLITEKSNQIWINIVEVLNQGMKEGFLKQDINPYEIALTLWSSSNGVILLMDHIRFSQNNKIKNEIGVCEDSPIQSEFEKIDLEKMLLNMWDMLIKSIRNN